MGSAIFKYVVELALLESARPDLLMAVLFPYCHELRGVGVDPDAALYSDAWLRRLHGAVNRDTDVIPASLQSTLMEIADLATDVGHDLIVQQAQELGADIFRNEPPMTREDLAFRAYLKHSDVFDAAHARLRPVATAAFVEFYARSATIARRHAGSLLSRLRNSLSARFVARNRTAFCHADVTEFEHETVFIFSHGGPPHRSTWIHDSVAIERAPLVPAEHDVIVYDHRANRLCVSATFPSDREMYRQLIGSVLADDDAYFRVWPAFTGAPLRERGAAALDSRDIPGLARVSLRKVTLARLDGAFPQLELAAEDLSGLMRREPLRSLLRRQNVGSWIFGIYVSAHECPMAVEVLPPNELRFDRRVPLERVREFMTLRGFLRPPTQELSNT